MCHKPFLSVYITTFKQRTHKMSEQNAGEREYDAEQPGVASQISAIKSQYEQIDAIRDQSIMNGVLMLAQTVPGAWSSLGRLANIAKVGKMVLSSLTTSSHGVDVKPYDEETGEGLDKADFYRAIKARDELLKTPEELKADTKLSPEQLKIKLKQIEDFKKVDVKNIKNLDERVQKITDTRAKIYAQREADEPVDSAELFESIQQGRQFKTDYPGINFMDNYGRPEGLGERMAYDVKNFRETLRNSVNGGFEDNPEDLDRIVNRFANAQKIEFANRIGLKTSVETEGFLKKVGRVASETAESLDTVVGAGVSKTVKKITDVATEAGRRLANAGGVLGEGLEDASAFTREGASYVSDRSAQIYDEIFREPFENLRASFRPRAGYHFIQMDDFVSETPSVAREFFDEEPPLRAISAGEAQRIATSEQHIANSAEFRATRGLAPRDPLMTNIAESHEAPASSTSLRTPANIAMSETEAQHAQSAGVGGAPASEAGSGASEETHISASASEGAHIGEEVGEEVGEAVGREIPGVDIAVGLADIGQAAASATAGTAISSLAESFLPVYGLYQLISGALTSAPKVNVTHSLLIPH